MAYGICRIQKLKAGSLAGSGRHTNRERYTPNADPTRQHIRIIGAQDGPLTPNLETLVHQRIGNQTIRKNAVLAVEFLLTASPEYFRPDNPAKAGYYHPDKLEDFQHNATQWLLERYGDRIVRAELHLDESTPHIHAYLVPLDEKGKLNCRALLGGSRYRLSELQDSFASSMANIGLERGIKGSRAKHTQIKQYYAAINQSPQTDLDPLTIQQQLADRQRALKEKQDVEQTNKALHQENQLLKLQLQKTSSDVNTLKIEASLWKKKYSDLADLVRDIPLEQVIYELGLDPDPTDKHKWINADHTINITGSKFYDWKHLKGGGGAIDLVMHCNQCDFKQAVCWLHDRLGEGAVLAASTYHVRQIVLKEPVVQFHPPQINPDKWSSVLTYLTRERRLPSGLIDALHHLGLIYADDKQNAVFLRRSLDGTQITGASIRGTAGTNNTFKGLARGSKRNDGWFFFTRGGQEGDHIQRAVLCESPIDALSFSVLDRTDSRKTIYLSTDGAGHLPIEFLQSLPSKSVIVAFDNDEAGKTMARQIITQLPTAICCIPSIGKDWNDVLLDYLHFEQLRPQQQTEHQRHRGFSL